MRNRRVAIHFCVLASLLSVTASAQVTFSTTTYSSDSILWNYLLSPSGTMRADLNGDGREDFITSGFCSGSFSVRLSTGDGAYGSPACYTIPSNSEVATNFAAGDFFGTGNMDVAVEDEVGDLYIYSNASGNGTLTLASSTTLPNGEGGILAADVNHDGRMDLVYEVGNPNGGGTVQALLGNGDGTFTPGPITTFTMRVDAGEQAIGDFDGDGKVDILVGDSGGEEIEILYGDGTGNFTPGPTIGGSPAGETSAVLTLYQPFDVDSDGTMELIGSPFTYTFCGTGCFPTIAENNYLDLESGHYNRTLTSQKIPLQHCSMSEYPPQVADFDGDGIADIIVAEDSDCKGDAPYTFNFLKGNGDGTFQPEQVIYSTTDLISDWHVMRASHSSKPDLALFQYQLVNNTLTNPEDLVLVNTTSGNFPNCTPLNNLATGINICGPTSTVGANPNVTFSLAGSNQTPGRNMEIWIDGQKMAENLKNTYSYYNFINQNIQLTQGEHQVAVFSVGWDYSLLLTQFPLLVGSNTCAPPGTFAVNVCSPLNNSTLTSPVLVDASGSVDSGSAIVRMEVWVDGVKMYSTFGSNALNTSLNLAPGWHQFTYFIVDNSGNLASTTVYAAVQ